MKLKKFSLWFSLAVIFALSANTLFLLMIQRAYDSVVTVQEHRQQAMLLVGELRQETEQLMSLVRNFSTGQTPYLTYYYDILAIRQGEKPHPENYIPGAPGIWRLRAKLCINFRQMVSCVRWQPIT